MVTMDHEVTRGSRPESRAEDSRPSWTSVWSDRLRHAGAEIVKMAERVHRNIKEEIAADTPIQVGPNEVKLKLPSWFLIWVFGITMAVGTSLLTGAFTLGYWYYRLANVEEKLEAHLKDDREVRRTSDAYVFRLTQEMIKAGVPVPPKP